LRQIADVSPGFSLEKISIKSQPEREAISAISLTHDTRETWNPEASNQAIIDDDAASSVE